MGGRQVLIIFKINLGHKQLEGFAKNLFTYFNLA